MIKEIIKNSRPINIESKDDTFIQKMILLIVATIGSMYANIRNAIAKVRGKKYKTYFADVGIEPFSSSTELKWEKHKGPFFVGRCDGIK